MTKSKTKLNEEGEIQVEQKRANREIFLDYAPYLIIILVVIIIRTFIATPIRVNGASMDPTLNNGETMVLNKLGMHLRGINRFDIIVARSDDSFLIKRVIGLPGERVKYEDGRLYINDEKIDDPFSLSQTYDFEEVLVGADEYFVLGDNRHISQDSRNPHIGNIHISEIRGKTNIILFPFNRFGRVE